MKLLVIIAILIFIGVFVNDCVHGDLISQRHGSCQKGFTTSRDGTVETC